MIAENYDTCPHRTHKICVEAIIAVWKETGIIYMYKGTVTGALLTASGSLSPANWLIGPSFYVTPQKQNTIPKIGPEMVLVFKGV